MVDSSQKDYFLKEEADAWHKRNSNSGSSNLHKKVIEAIWGSIDPREINEWSSILEVGSSQGALLSLVCDEFNVSGVGVDPSEKAVAAGNDRRSKNLKLKVGTSDSIPESDESFNLVIAGFFLYVVDRKLFLKTLAELDRCLAPGGYLLIVDFDSKIPTKKPYRETSNVWSYRNDNAGILTAMAHYSLISKASCTHHGSHFSSDAEERISIEIFYKEPDPYFVTAPQRKQSSSSN
jgi:ubiquinone/menaquinone biosynthesis C-methylase UbiE